jgi:hypothetical protein
MSHLTKLKTKLNNKEFLLKALTKMGFTYKEGENLKTKGNYNQVHEVDILIEGNGKQSYNSAIGFKKETDGTYTAVGDFFALRDAAGNSISAKSLGVNCTKMSKEAEVNHRLGQLRFEMDKSSRVEKGSKVTFTMQRWVP